MAAARVAALGATMAFGGLEVDAARLGRVAPTTWLLHAHGTGAHAAPAEQHGLALVGRHRHEVCQEQLELDILVHAPLERRGPPL